MARSVPGRPAPTGAVTPGKSTRSRSGSTGNRRRSLVCSLIVSSFRTGKSSRFITTPHRTVRAARLYLHNENTALTAVFLTSVALVWRLLLPKWQSSTAGGYLFRIFLAPSRHESKSASLESPNNPALIVVSRSASSGLDSHTKRTISAGPRDPLPPPVVFTIPEVLPMRSTFQLLPSRSLNVRMEPVTDSLAERLPES